MTTRQILLRDATELLHEAIEQRDRVRELAPERLPTATAVLLEITRAHMIIATSKRLTARKNIEIVARVARANIMTQALQRPLQ